MNSDLHQSAGYKMMGAAFEVYNDRGYGMAEEVYQESLEIEFELRSIPYQSKRELSCHYKGRELKRKYVPDLFVFDCLVVELKAVTQLLSEHEAQLFNYLRLSQKPVGYLVNFGHKDTLEWKRIILSEFISVHPSAQISAD